MTGTSSGTLLSGYTTLRVGGPARELRELQTRQELIDAALDVWATPEEWLVLGGGSNVVIGDSGFDGTVLHVSSRGIERIPSGSDRVRLRVEAGEPWESLVARAVADGLAGLEALSGIPGSCGASPIQNIGAYGQELGDSLVAVDFLDYLTGEIERMPAAVLGLGYRTSVFKQGREGIVLAIEVDLEDSTLSRPIAYEQLASALGVELGDRVPIERVRSTVLALRSSKGMVLDEVDSDTWSAGSYFTNPIVGESFARHLPWNAPRFPAGEESVKLSAAWLIERAGIRRGFALPGSRARVSSKHTLALTNTGGATSREVTELARFVAERVRNEFGVSLHPEPSYVAVDEDAAG